MDKFCLSVLNFRNVVYELQIVSLLSITEWVYKKVKYVPHRNFGTIQNSVREGAGWLNVGEPNTNLNIIKKFKRITFCI